MWVFRGENTVNEEKIQKKIMYMEELYEKVQQKFWEAWKGQSF